MKINYIHFCKIIILEEQPLCTTLIGENILRYLFLFLASKNHKGEKYGVGHQAMVKDVEVAKDVINLDIQRRIDEADLQIASVSLYLDVNRLY